MASPADPGPLIGRGRAADVFDIGDGRVLRRNRGGASTALEAEVMRYLATQGYPVPAIHDAEGADLVMERVDGPTMLDAFARTPWKMRGWARDLSRLHDQLEAVALPDIELEARFGDPEVLVHGDLHPDNVILARSGPVVIDWPNVSLGLSGSDVANTWIITATTELEGSRLIRSVQSAGRSAFLREFLRHVDRSQAHSRLPGAAALRLKDRNLRPAEAANIHRLLEAEGLPALGGQ